MTNQPSKGYASTMQLLSIRRKNVIKMKKVAEERIVQWNNELAALDKMIAIAGENNDNQTN